MKKKSRCIFAESVWQTKKKFYAEILRSRRHEREFREAFIYSPARSSTLTVVRVRSALDEGISRAKIRSIQQTVLVILTYVCCSTPLICVQLWMVYGQPSLAVIKSVAWLFWLLTQQRRQPLHLFGLQSRVEAAFHQDLPEDGQMGLKAGFGRTLI